MLTRIAILSTVALSLHAAVPALQELSPRGAQRGKTFTLYLKGDGLTPNAQIKTELPASFSRLTRSKDPLEANAMARPNAVLPLLVSVNADAPIGIYPIRVLTPDGISNVLLFAVSDLPEIDEIEAKDRKQINDAPAAAQKIQVPTVVNGTLQGADVDIDNYTFTAKAGQKLVFEILARRAGSAVDPAFEIFDAAGNEIAKNDDAPGLGVDSRLEVTFAKAGDYRIQVHDSKYANQQQNFYRLQIASYAFGDSLFPLGWKRGETTEVSVAGGNLSAPIKVKQPAATKASYVPVRLPGSQTATPMLFAVSDETELLEPADGAPATLPENAFMNGRITKPGEIDKYKVRVKPGEKWLFELTAASLGTSRLDALITLYDAAGKKLASADDGNGPDPFLPITIPDGVTEVTLAVEDLMGQGGPGYGYRLQARRQQQDFVAELATPFANVPAGGTAQVVVTILRHGYDGAIRVRIPTLPAGFHVAGGSVPSEAAAQNFNNDNAGRRTARTVLTITADPDVPQQAFEIKVVAEAETPDGIIRRQAQSPGLVTIVGGIRQKPFTAPWLELPMMVATTSAPPITVGSSTPLVRIAQGFEYNLDYRVRRTAAAKSPAKVSFNIGGAVGNLRVLKGLETKNTDTGVYLVSTNFATPVTTFDMLLEAQTDMDGKTVSVPSAAVTIQVVPGYQVQLEKTALDVTPGGKIEIAGHVHREPTFEGGLVRVTAEDLPDHVRCASVEVPAGQRDFRLACEADTQAAPGAFDVRITSVAPETGRKAKGDYKGPELNAKLVVARATQAAAR